MKVVLQFARERAGIAGLLRVAGLPLASLTLACLSASAFAHDEPDVWVSNKGKVIAPIPGDVTISSSSPQAAGVTQLAPQWSGYREVRDTRSLPYSAVVALDLFDHHGKKGFEGECTGFLVSPDTVVTSGHCVNDSVTNHWRAYVHVSAGRGSLGGQAYFPFEVCKSKALYAPKMWVEHKSANYDYGVIKLGCEVGTRTGWLGIDPQYLDNEENLDLLRRNSIIIGYGNYHFGQLESRKDVVGVFSFKVAVNNELTMGADSFAKGSPILSGRKFCSLCVFAVLHSSEKWGGFGVRLDKKALGFIQRIILSRD